MPSMVKGRLYHIKLRLAGGGLFCDTSVHVFCIVSCAQPGTCDIAALRARRHQRPQC